MIVRPAGPCIVLKVLWCIYCVRNATELATGDDVAFRINCCYSPTGSSKCISCEGSRPCDRPAEGMRGDAYDLSSILAWASFFWEDNVEQPLDYPKWSPEFKAAVKVASKKLAKSFEACEKTHRIAHKLIRDKGETPEIRISEYHQFIMERYTLYPNPIKQPETRAGKAEWDAFNCEQGQRLRDGDPGHMAWAVAKQVFYDSVQRALLEMPLLNAEALSVLQEDFAKSFPVTLHSI